MEVMCCHYLVLLFCTLFVPSLSLHSLPDHRWGVESAAEGKCIYYLGAMGWAPGKHVWRCLLEEALLAPIQCVSYFQPCICIRQSGPVIPFIDTVQATACLWQGITVLLSQRHPDKYWLNPPTRSLLCPSHSWAKRAREPEDYISGSPSRAWSERQITQGKVKRGIPPSLL